MYEPPAANVGKEALPNHRGIEFQSSTWKASLVDLTHAENGIWKVEPVRGSLPIKTLKVASEQPAPVVEGKLESAPRDRQQLKLAYALGDGQKLALISTGKNSHSYQLLGRAKGASCSPGGTAFRGRKALCQTFKFSPRYAPGADRTISAWVENPDGKLLEKVNIASFKAKVPKPKAPRARIIRRGDKVLVRWSKVRYATSYAVGLHLGGGRGLSNTVEANETVFTHVPVTDSMTATAYPVMSDGVTAPTATVARKAKRISKLGFVGVKRQNHSFNLTPGKTYTLRVLSEKHPTYIDAAPVPAQPHGGHFPFATSGMRDGTSRWTMRVHLPSDIADNFHYWVIGVTVGKKTYDVKIHVLPPKHRSARILMTGVPATGTSGSSATGTSGALSVTTFAGGVVNFGMPPSS